MPDENFSSIEKDLQSRVGNLLRAGVLLSSVVVLIGGILYLAEHGRAFPHYHQFREDNVNISSFSAVFRGAIKGNSLAIIQIGVLLLIATPVARIIFSMTGFIKEKDRLYIFVSSLILIIIAFSMLSGLKG